MACEAGTPCEKCAKDSEMSWNPDEKFATPRLRRFYEVGDSLEAAYKADDAAAVEKLAAEYLELADVYGCNWNYGNAIHDANRFLGLVHLRNGNADTAAQYLLRAGKSTGSPQLNSFGPDLDLANELLKVGQIEPVKAYLTDIKRFWRMDNGQVRTWLAEIDKGGKPELNRFGAMQPSTAQLAFFGFALAWPALIVLVSLYWLRHQISRKWWFAIAASIGGYLAMMAANWALFSFPRAMAFVGVYTSIALTFLIAVFAVVLISRFFVRGKAS
jgi:hypothetical protein